MPGKSRSRGVAKAASKMWVKHERRYPRNVAALLATPMNELPGPTHSDRLHSQAFRRAIDPLKGKPKLTAQEQFWRSAGSRYLIGAAASASGLGAADLEAELGIARAEGRVLKKFEADFDGDAVMSWPVLNRLSRRAYARGLLPHVAEACLYDEGAFAVALVIGNIVCETREGREVVLARAAASHVTWRDKYVERVSKARKELAALCKHARAAYRDLAAFARAAGVGDPSAVRSTESRAVSRRTVALRALKLLEVDFDRGRVATGRI